MGATLAQDAYTGFRVALEADVTVVCEDMRIFKCEMSELTRTYRHIVYVPSGASFPVFDGDVALGFVRADFSVPVTVNKVKKTLDIWFNLWFDRDHSHYNACGEGIGAATLEEFN